MDKYIYVHIYIVLYIPGGGESRNNFDPDNTNKMQQFHDLIMKILS